MREEVGGKKGSKFLFLYVRVAVNLAALYSVTSSIVYLLDTTQATRLAEIAVHLGSSDNITIIIIRFFTENL